MLPHDDMVLNVLAFYADSTPAERAHGRAWYPSALDAAERVAAIAGVSTAQGVAVIAALSPQTEWTHNVRWANQVATAHALGLPLPRRGLGNNLKRATMALQGLDDIERVKGTRKVHNFYHSILGTPGAVCVDRHALRIAAGDAFADVPSVTDKRYDVVADAYRDAARELKIRSSTVQATTWVTCKRIRDNGKA